MSSSVSKLQLEGPESFHVGNLSVEHAAGATSASHVFSFGGRLVRNEVAVNLAGEGAGTELNGLFCANSGQHVDCHTLIDHVAPRAGSAELYKGVLDGTGRRVQRKVNCVCLGGFGVPFECHIYFTHHEISTHSVLRSRIISNQHPKVVKSPADMGKAVQEVLAR